MIVFVIPRHIIGPHDDQNADVTEEGTNVAVKRTKASSCWSRAACRSQIVVLIWCAIFILSPDGSGGAVFFVRYILIRHHQHVIVTSTSRFYETMFNLFSRSRLARHLPPSRFYRVFDRASAKFDQKTKVTQWWTQKNVCRVAPIIV